MVQLQAAPLGPVLLAQQREGLHCDAEVRLCSAKAVVHYAVLAARCTALPYDADTRCTALANDADTRCTALANDTDTRCTALANDADTRCTALANDADSDCSGDTLKVVTLASEQDVFSSLLSESVRQREVLEKFIEFLYGLEVMLPCELLPVLTRIMRRLGCTHALCDDGALELREGVPVPCGSPASAGSVAVAVDDFVHGGSVAFRDADPNKGEKMSLPSEEEILNGGGLESRRSYFSLDKMQDGKVCEPCGLRNAKKYDEEPVKCSTAVRNPSLLHECSSNDGSSNCCRLEVRHNPHPSTDDPLCTPRVCASPSRNGASSSNQEMSHECQQKAFGDDIDNAGLGLKKVDERHFERCDDAKRLSDEAKCFSTCVPDLSILTIGTSEKTSPESECVLSVENHSDHGQNLNDVKLKNTSGFLETVPSVAVCNIDSEDNFLTSYPSSLNDSRDILHSRTSARFMHSVSQNHYISDTRSSLTEDVVPENSSISIVCEPTHSLRSFEVVKSCLSPETTKLVENTANLALKHSDQNDFGPEEFHNLSGANGDTPGAREALAVIHTSPASSSTKMAVAVSTFVDSPFAGGSLTCALQPNTFVPISGILPSTQGGLQCGQCQASFRKCSDLVKHVLSDLHFTETCPICLAKAPDVESQRNHFVLHDSPLPFFCHGCDLRFRTRAHLAMHAPKHSSARPFSCPECSRAFKWRHALQAHLLTHRPMGHLLCDVCGFSSNYITTFKAHLQQHSGVAFSCTQPGCSFKAFRKDNLKAHLGTHSNVRPHQCEVCGTSFSLFRNLRRHMRVHSGLRLQCASCPFTTTRADKLRCHVSAKHHVALDPAESGPQSGPAEQTPSQASVVPYTNLEEMRCENGISASELEAEHNVSSVNDHIVLSVRGQDTKAPKSGEGGGQKRRKSTFCPIWAESKRMQNYSRDGCLIGSSVNEQAAGVTQSSSYGQNDLPSTKKSAKKRVHREKIGKREIKPEIKRKPRLIYPKPPPVSTSSISFLEGKLETSANENLLAISTSDVR